MAEHEVHAPGIPEIHDDAADSPLWLPVLGLSLLLLGAVYTVISSAMEDLGGEAPAAEVAAEIAGEHAAH